jgi:hypothetical protein
MEGRFEAPHLPDGGREAALHAEDSCERSAAQQASGQAGKRASGQAGKRASGQAGKRASGQAGKRERGEEILRFAQDDVTGRMGKRSFASLRMT